MLRQATRFVNCAWDGLQVGHNGSFSSNRLLQLNNFIQQQSPRFSWLRVMPIIFWTPIPCLTVALLSEVLPLAPPSAGPKTNGVFWIRSWLVQMCYTYAFFVQVLHCIPAVPQRLLLLVPVSALVSAAHVATHFGVALTLGFPVPFSSLLLDTPWIIFIVIALWAYVGPDCRSDPHILVQFKKVVVVAYASSSLAIVYPLFYYAFLEAKAYPHAQITLTLLVLPSIKLLEKHLLYRVTCYIPDLQPAYIAFNVEVFNALFVSSCMPNATSITVTASLMVADFLSSSAALYGLRNLMTQIDKMNAKMSASLTRGDMLFVAALMLSSQRATSFASESATDQSVPEPRQDMVSRQNKLDIATTNVTLPASRLSERNSRESIRTKTKKFNAIRVAALPALVPKPPLKKKISNNTLVESLAKVTPLPVLQQGLGNSVQPDNSVSTKLIQRLSPREQQYFVLEASRVLCRVETLLIIEYTEIVVPMLYAIYMGAVYHLPNRIYFPYLRDLSDSDLASAIRSVVLYGMLQLLSFVLLVFAISRHCQLLPGAQLHFVLLREGKLVQSMLTLWVTYVLQTPLDHAGTDYTFKFEWLRRTNT